MAVSALSRDLGDPKFISLRMNHEKHYSINFHKLKDDREEFIFNVSYKNCACRKNRGCVNGLECETENGNRPVHCLHQNNVSYAQR